MQFMNYYDLEIYSLLIGKLASSPMAGIVSEVHMWILWTVVGLWIDVMLFCNK